MKTKIYTAFALIILVATFNKISAQNANTSLSNLAAPTAVNVNLIPDKNNKRNLGSATKAWNKIYFDTAIYFDSIRFITALGSDNTAIGNKAMYLNRGGTGNTVTGSQSLYNNLYGTENTSIGYQALYQNINSSNTAIGCRALYGGGSNCTATGFEALYNGNKSAYGNTADGYQAMHENTSGETNTAVGFNALYNNTTGNNNVAIGNNSLAQSIKVSDNVAVGNNALAWLIDGAHCTAVGSQAGYKNESGANNTYLGYHAGNTVENGSSNTIVGYGADLSDANFNNATAIGNLAVSGASNRVRIGNGSVTSIGGTVSWTNFSDERIKSNIKQDVPGLAFINLLKPVTYNFDLKKEEQIFKRKDSAEWKEKYDIQKIKFTGFLAQEVEAAAKKINYDFSGVDAPKNDKDVYGLRYSDFVVPLVKAVQELSKQNDSLQKQNNDLENKYENQQKEIDELKTMLPSNQSTANTQLSALSSASLSQNIPNPFSNSTTIHYSIPQTFSSARIIITDKNGNATKQINLSQCKGTVTVDASTLINGAYQYTLYINGKLVDSKQMILSK